MSVRKRNSKRAKNGYVYEVNFRYKENGVSKRYIKGGFKTLKEAKEHETMMSAELLETGKIKKDIKKTFNDVYEEFLEIGADQYQENTIYNTKKHYKSCKNELSHVLISNFDYPFLQKYFNSLKDQGIETNIGIKKTINRVLNYAVKMNYIKNNPINLVTVTGIENHNDRDEILNFDDFLTLTNALDDFQTFNRSAQSIAIKIGYYTGLRVSEILALDKKDIDLDLNEIYVNKKLVYCGLKKEKIHTTNQLKSKKSKAIIPLAAPLKESLIEWYKENPYDKLICDQEGYYLNPGSMSTSIKSVATKLNINFHFHMLRHTFATKLVTSDVDLKTAQELMRHSSINTTMSVYTHINNVHKLNVINNVFNANGSELVASSTKEKTLN